LSSQIEQMDTQISLTGLQIQNSEQKITETQSEIEKLTSRIDNLDSSLNILSKLLLAQIVKGYKTQPISLIEILFVSQDITDLANKIKYQRSTQNNNQKLLVQVQEAKSNYEEQKVIREQKKKELDQLILDLEAQKASLTTQQAQKQRLLDETNNDETTYQNLLAQAEAQLAAFGHFVSNQGGSSLLSNQTVCDDWDVTITREMLNGEVSLLTIQGTLLRLMGVLLLPWRWCIRILDIAESPPSR